MKRPKKTKKMPGLAHFLKNMGVLLEPIDHSSAQEELNFVAFFDDKCSTFKNIRFSPFKLHSHSV